MTGKQEVEAVTSRSRRLIVQFADHPEVGQPSQYKREIADLAGSLERR